MFHLTSNHPTTAEDAYGVLNARLGWTAPGGRYGASLFATNLTDEVYAVNRSWVGSLGFATANFARPREVGITLRAAF
jgi:iron complex outermembrane receptor protein